MSIIALALIFGVLGGGRVGGGDVLMYSSVVINMAL